MWGRASTGGLCAALEVACFEIVVARFHEVACRFVVDSYHLAFLGPILLCSHVCHGRDAFCQRWHLDWTNGFVFIVSFWEVCEHLLSCMAA